MSWDGTRGHWGADSWNPEAMYSTQQLPAVAFGDGPPYSEDEDLHSPIVTTSRHRKHKSSGAALISDGTRGPGGDGRADSGREIFVGVNGDGSQTYYVGDDDADDDLDDGPGGEYVTYPVDEGSNLGIENLGQEGQRYVHFAPTLSDGQYNRGMTDSEDDISEDGSWQDRSRYSRDYQFTIVSPDEEMHGKAVALFDFTREHENELPLTEGQVILVSYRHGQGWLVAEDPKTGESGLVPEEFVRLVRDIEGGLNGLNGALLNASLEEGISEQESSGTQVTNGPTSDCQTTQPDNVSNGIGSPDDDSRSGNTNDTNFSSDKEGTFERDKSKEREKRPPVVSTFSTSSRDLHPYPLSTQQHRKSTPPQIEHYGPLTGGENFSAGRPISLSKSMTKSSLDNGSAL